MKYNKAALIYWLSIPSMLVLLSYCTHTDQKTMPSQTSYYTEPHRPQFHFSPEAHWMNDPNGLVYQDGEYHLFYQYYPDSTVWGPMHWGHAVSSDMLHWKHLPIALYPDSLGLIFSGSAVIDKNNTAGFGKDAMIAIYTQHHQELEKAGSNEYQYQSIAYSTDKGRTFKVYEGNPVIKNPGIKDFRDPKVIWDQKNNQWVMVFSAYDKALFYTSPNLKDWTKTGEFGIEGDKRLWECPDLFPMKVVETGEEKWILIVSIQQQGPNGGSATGYFVGDFDGKTFLGHPDDQKWLDHGKDNYAFVTWSNLPDDRIIGIGWMSNWQYAQQVPTDTWRSANTLPRSMTLHKMKEGYIIKSMPVREVDSLLSTTIPISKNLFTESDVLPEDTAIGTYKIDLTIKRPSVGTATIRLSNSSGATVQVGFDADNNQFFIDRTHAGSFDHNADFKGRHTAPAAFAGDTIHMNIYVDHASVELFVDEGVVVMTEIVFPGAPLSKIEFEGNVDVVDGKISRVKRVW